RAACIAHRASGRSCSCNSTAPATRAARPSAVLLPPLHRLHRHRHRHGALDILDIRSLGQKIAGSEPPQKQISLNHRASVTRQPFVSNRTRPGLPLLNKENPTWRGAARRESYHPVKVLIACILTVAGVPAPASAGTTAEWKGGGGAWENAAMWGGTLPSRTAEARINGTQDKPSEVILTHTKVLVNQLSV